MPITRNVFGSRAERDNFYKLSRTWGDKYRVYHNLPYLNVFPVSEAERLMDLSAFPPQVFRIAPKERNRLKKTSIDFTLCDENDAPVVCIEFDGIQRGYNVGTRYYSTHEGEPLPWRQEITEPKLRVAHGLVFPFFIVGVRQFDDLSASLKLTIVDGIIGEVIAKRAATERFSHVVGPEDLGLSKEEYATLLPWEIDELLQDWVIGVEVESDIEHNPIIQEVLQLSNITGCHSYRTRYLSSPLKSSKFVGAEVVIHTGQFGDITRSAWLPNFGVPNFSGLSLIEDIARLLALDVLARRMSAK